MIDRRKDSDFKALWFLSSYHNIMTTTSTLPSIGVTKLSNASYAAFMRAFSQLVQQAPLEKLGLKADEWTPF